MNIMVAKFCIGAKKKGKIKIFGKSDSTYTIVKKLFGWSIMQFLIKYFQFVFMVQSYQKIK